MTALDLAALPFDAARQKTLRFITRSSLVTRVVGRRKSRVAILATVQVLTLFLIAVLFPVGMFFVGPMILGAAHLAADARYLVLRRRLPRGFVILSAASATMIVALRSLEVLGVLHASVDAWETSAGALWIVSALIYAARDWRSARRALVVGGVFAGIFAVALTHARLANVVMMHAHNVIGIATWVFLFQRRKLWELFPIVVLVAAVAVMLSGAALPWAYHWGGAFAFGTHITAIGRWLAPGLTPHASASVVTSFVFLQAVHYGVWLTWIPQEDLAGEGTPTFRMTLRGLVADFGAVGCALVALVVVGLAAVALFRIQSALTWYITLSRFHGLLELAVIAFLVVRGGLPLSPSRRT